MFIVHISNPKNEKEFKCFNLIGEHPRGELLRKALWGVGRQYAINFYPSSIYINTKSLYKDAPKVTLNELITEYSKIKFYDVIKHSGYNEQVVWCTKEFKYPKELVSVDISKNDNRHFLRLNSTHLFTTVNDTLFVDMMNRELGTDFHFCTHCYSCIINDGTLDIEDSKIIRRYKTIEKVPYTYTTKELI